MYRLYVNQQSFEMVIEPAGNLIIYDTIDYSEPYCYDAHYTVCINRKKLQELAKQIKRDWQTTLELKLSRVENMKIRNKYK